MQRYSAEEHFKRLDETTDLIKSHLKKYEAQISYPDMLNGDPIWTERVHATQSRFLRPLIARNVMEMVYGETVNWKDYSNILSSVELFNISTYQSDYIFDNPLAEHQESSSNDRRNVAVRQFTASYLTYTAALDKLLNAKMSFSIRVTFIEKMVLAAQRVYEGQHVDAFVLRRRPGVKDPLSLSDTLYLDRYIERCRNMDGYQFAMSFYYGLVSNDQIEEDSYRQIGKLLWEIGIYFGICIQILNDIEGLSPTGGITPEDIKDEKITYPIYLLWNNSDRGREILELCWESGDVPENALREIQKAVQSCSETSRCLLQLMMYYYKKISSNIKQLKSYPILNTHYLDFIFPHIFLSRIAKSCIGRDGSYNDLLNSIR